jgi:hypothetical protein
MNMAVALMVSAAVIGTACDRSPVDPPGHEELGTVEIVDPSTNVVLATWTHDDGWDEPLATTLSHAAEADRTRAVLGVRMWTEDGHSITLAAGGEYSARYRIHADPDGIIDMDESLDLFHGDHVYVYGYHEEGRTGTAQLVFQLFHGGHSDGDTDPIAFVITD